MSAPPYPLQDFKALYKCCIIIIIIIIIIIYTVNQKKKLKMWANAKRDGRSAEHRWRPLLTPHILADAHY